MKKHLLAFLGNYDHVEDEQPEQDIPFLDLIHEAREEWMTAQNYFENVTDPDLIDYAIYKIEATRRKYMYMLKQARVKGISDDRIIKRADRAAGH